MPIGQIRGPNGCGEAGAAGAVGVVVLMLDG
jgi:hypothetical protein